MKGINKMTNCNGKCQGTYCEGYKDALSTVKSSIEQKILLTDHTHNADVIEGLAQARDIINKENKN